MTEIAIRHKQTNALASTVGWGLLFLVLNSPFNCEVEYRKVSAYITAACVLLSCFVFIITALYNCRFHPVKATINTPMMLFFIILLVSFFHGVALSNNFVYALGDLFQFGEMVFFYLLITFVMTDNDIYAALRSGLIVVILSSIVQYALNYAGMFSDLYLAIDDVATRKVDNDLIPVAFIMLIVFYLNADLAGKKTLAIPMVLMSFCLILTYTRSYWFGVVAGLIYVVIKRMKNIWMFGRSIVVGIMIVFALMSMSTSVSQRVTYTIEQLTSPTHPEQLQRQIEFYAAMEQIINHPLLGLGLGAEFEADIFNRFTGNVEETKKHFVHNAFLRIALATGLPGLLAYFWIMWKASKTKHFAMGYDILFWSTLRLAVVSAIITSLVISFTKADMTLHPLSAYIGILLGMLCKEEKRAIAYELSCS